MKTYNSPKTQITDCKAAYMLMIGNVSGGGFSGVKQWGPSGGELIEIN